MSLTSDPPKIPFNPRHNQKMAANPPPQDPLPNAPPTALLDPPYSYVAYGGDTNCTLEICPVILSVYQYRPSVPANAVFIALFGLSMVIHLVQAFLWKTWTFGILMAIGCLTEILGYAGRIILYNDPFSFSGFLLQISTFNASSPRKMAPGFSELGDILQLLKKAR